MTLRHFRIFVTVCDAMNMTLAAEKLFISQSAVSQAIFELEDFYKTRLFERLSRRLYLTQSGTRLLPYARHILKMTEEVEKEMRVLAEEPVIRIGASVTVGGYFLPKIVSAYQQESKTTLFVVEDNTSEIERLLLKDEVDIGIVEGDLKSADLISEAFLEDELVLISGQGHPFFHQPIVKPQQLEKEAFLVREQGSGTRQLFERVMALHGVQWKLAWTCNNTDTIKNGVAEGVGISVISKRAVENEIRNGELHLSTIEGMSFCRSFKIVYHKNKFLSLPLKSLMDFCRKPL